MFWNNMQEHVVSLQIVAKFKFELEVDEEF